MHCHTTEDPAATWRESWRALEREYAEGRVMAIGVSNFDAALLAELEGGTGTSVRVRGGGEGEGEEGDREGVSPVVAGANAGAGAGAVGYTGAGVLPHVVQNWAEPGRVDEAVRRWCGTRGALYQPYAPLRNLRFMPPHTRDALRRATERLNRDVDRAGADADAAVDAAGSSVSNTSGAGGRWTEHTTALLFFLQSGAQCIPRSTRWEHLVQNIRPALDRGALMQGARLSDEEMASLGWTFS
jgi:diketogulonate reductase-like aldo/keto reductase